MLVAGVFCAAAFFALSGVAWSQEENPGSGGENPPPGCGSNGGSGGGGDFCPRSRYKRRVR